MTEQTLVGRPLPDDLDPSLPGLASALDPARVALQFEHRWPGSGHVSAISACQPKHVRWSPGVDCVVTYGLQVESGDGQSVPTIGVVEVDPGGVRHRLFAADDLLPGLAHATDPTVMSRWLAERLRRSVERCSITPVTYRPGRRCVLRYELSGDGVTVLYGKVLSDDRAVHLASTVASLGDSLVPALVGVAPEWQLVVQADAGSHNLDSVTASTHSPRTLAELRAGGRLLGRLHGCLGAPGVRRTLEEDAGALGGYLLAAKRVSPDSAASLAEGIDRLRALADPASPSVPSHGAFRLDQVQLASGEPRLIDLDSYCWAEPARDVGNLLAYLRWRAIRQPARRVAVSKVSAAFLAGYTSTTLIPLHHHRVRAYEAASLLKIAGRRYRRLAVDEWERVPIVIAAAIERLGASVGRAG